MGEKSAIEWTDATWNPIRARHIDDRPVGWHCEHVSEGCRNCYAETMNRRLGTGLDFKPGHRANIEIFLDEKMLLAPLRWKKPRMIFVCSMTDAFADFVKDEWLDRMFAVMALCPQHKFQVLTKRPGRMYGFIDGLKYFGLLPERIADATRPILATANDIRSVSWNYPAWPLPNIWLGISCEDQATADERIPLLLKTAAAVRFVSAEPVLAPIDFTNLDYYASLKRAHPNFERTENDPNIFYDVLDGHMKGPDDIGLPKLDWVIVGGESGPHARPMHPDWARSIRDQCKAAGVPFFFKQWGENAPRELIGDDRKEPWRRLPNGSENWAFDELSVSREQREAVVFSRVGKRVAGRLLDGIEHNEMPG